MADTLRVRSAAAAESLAVEGSSERERSRDIASNAVTTLEKLVEFARVRAFLLFLCSSVFPAVLACEGMVVCM